MTRFYEPDLGANPDSPFARDGARDGKIGITHCDDVRGQRAKANKAGEYLTASLLCVALVDLKTQPKSTIPFLRAGIFDEIEDVRTRLVTFMQQRT